MNSAGTHHHKAALQAGLFLAALLGLAALWRWTPLGDWLTGEQVAAWIDMLQGHALAGLGAAVAIFVVGSLLVIPQMVLVLGTVLAFGAVEGFVYSYIGTMAASAATYLAGRELGRDTMRRLGGTRVDRISRYLSRRGVRTMLVMSILPVAPFTVVNMVAGASHIRFKDYFVGTALGIWTGILAIAVFGAQLKQLVRHPNLDNVLVLAAVVAIGAVVLYWLQHHLRRFIESRNGNGGGRAGA